MNTEKTKRFQGSSTGARFAAIALIAGLAANPAVSLSAQSAQPTGAQTSFASQFAPYTASPARAEAQPAAVDLTTIEIPREAKPKPKTIAHHSVKADHGVVVASYYGKRFHGRKTANGERFNMNAMTAAHKKLRFGTKVRVTNVANGRSVVVRINDRGPYIRGRTIDLSRAAAQKIGMIQRGHARVRMEVIS